MKWTTATALFLALSAGGVGALVVATRQPLEAGDVLADIGENMSDPLFDKSDALRRLERVLDDPKTTSDRELLARHLRTRSDIYRGLGEYGKAIADLENLKADRAAVEGGPDDALGLEIAELLAREGRVGTALARTQRLTRGDSAYAPAWALEAKLEERKARAQLSAAAELAQQTLPSEMAEKAYEILIELTARDLRDPGRAELMVRLEETFQGMRESRRNDVLELIPEPVIGFERARVAFGKALGVNVTSSLVVALADSFERAGRRDLAIQLQLAARQIPTLAQDSTATAALVDDLLSAQRLEEAKAILSRWKWEDGGTLEFYRSAGEVLYKAEEYRSMGPVATGLTSVGGQWGAHWAGFFNSIRSIKFPNQNDLQDGGAVLARRLRVLRDFAVDETLPEPFPNAKKLSWFLLAEGQRQIGQLDAERSSLRKALGLLPNHSADAWVRFAETLRLSKRSTPWAEIEMALTKALDLAPERTAELEPLWFEAGENALKKRGQSIQGIIASLTRLDKSIPPPSSAVGPSMLTRIAENHLANGRVHAAVSAANEARRGHKSLIPPLDVLIDAELNEPTRYKVERDIVRRIEAAGVDETMEKALARLPNGSLQGEWLIRAIRAAPRRFGKASVARWQLDNGDAVRASETLRGVDSTVTPPELSILGARLLLDSESWKGASVMLKNIEYAPRHQSEILLLRLRALIGGGQKRDLEGLAREMQATLQPNDPTLLAASDLLAAGGRIDLALAFIDNLDKKPATRTAEFYRRRVLVDLLAVEKRGFTEAKESILRAEPYLRDGTPEIAAILLAVAERSWTDLADLVKRLEESSFKPTPYQSAALALLGERLESGQRAAAAGLEKNPRDPRWALIAAAADALVDKPIVLPPWFGPMAAIDAERLLGGINRRKAKDPRDALAILLVANDPVWHAWAIPRLESLDIDTQSTIWAPMLRIAIESAKGHSEQQRTIIEQILTDHPRFGPAHELSVQLAEERYPTEPLHPEVVRARSARLASLGRELINDEIEVAIAKAGEFAGVGKYKEAVDEMLPVILSGGPKVTQGRIMLSIFEIRAGQHAFAALHLQEAALADLGVYEDVALKALVGAIKDAVKSNEAGTSQRGTLNAAKAAEMLEELSLRYPLDPIIALERLKLLDLKVEERASRARGLLSTIARNSDGKSLNELRRGATTRWVEFLAPLAPKVAADLVEEQLELEPGNLELLRLAGYVAEQDGRIEEAKRNYGTYLDIAPDSDTGYALVELMIREGATPGQIRPRLNMADRSQAGGSARSTYLNSLAQLRGRQPDIDAINQALGGLWRQRERSRHEVDPLSLGLLYADVLMRRALPDDLETLGALIADLRPLAEDTLYEGQFLDGLEGVRTHMIDEPASDQ